MRPWTLAFLIAGFSFADACWAIPFGDELHLPDNGDMHRISYMVAIPAGKSFTLMDVDGPGCVTHIWMTSGSPDGRDLILRMYWDGEQDPSVEAPLTDFFGVGHNKPSPGEPFATPCLTVAPQNGYNIYLPMPFRKHARITITNDSEKMVDEGGGIYFQADYATYPSLSANMPYFHAQWRREAPALRRARPYTILEAVGKGFIAGVTYHVRIDDTADEWFHGGGDYIYIDGGTAPNLLKGIGGEDFIGQSWHNDRFIGPNAGCTVAGKDTVSLYRFFLEGPPHFEHSVRFAYGAMANEITSVGYWYQNEPHSRFCDLPPRALRTPDSTIPNGQFDIELEPKRQLDVAVIGPFAGTAGTPTPLDGLTPLDLSLRLRTNYQEPYMLDDALLQRRAVQWEHARTILSWLDLEAVFKPKMRAGGGVAHMPNTFAYALLRLTTDKAQSAKLLVGHDDAVRIWVNGNELSALKQHETFTGDTVELPLQSGRNEVLLKAANTWNTNFAAWDLSLRLLNPAGIHADTFSALPIAPDGNPFVHSTSPPEGPPAPTSGKSH